MTDPNVQISRSDLDRLVKIARAARVSEWIDVVGPHDDAVVRRAESVIRTSQARQYADMVAA